MSQTYKATGINLKSMPMGESDRILTVLTREYGLIRAIAPGSRKPKAKLGGRGELFVVNQLLLSKGRSMDRISQAESVESFPGLSRDLAKLTVGQYWAEMILYQTPNHDPNPQLFDLLCQRLVHLAMGETGPIVLVQLIYGILQLLELGGIAPQVQYCSRSHQPIRPEDLGSGRVVFSPAIGGIILPTQTPAEDPQPLRRATLTLSALELKLMQQLMSILEDRTQRHDLLSPLLSGADDLHPWLNIEQALRTYVQYHTERPIRSAALLTSCFLPSSLTVSAGHP